MVFEVDDGAEVEVEAVVVADDATVAAAGDDYDYDDV